VHRFLDHRHAARRRSSTLSICQAGRRCVTSASSSTLQAAATWRCTGGASAPWDSRKGAATGGRGCVPATSGRCGSGTRDTSWVVRLIVVRRSEQLVRQREAGCSCRGTAIASTASMSDVAAPAGPRSPAKPHRPTGRRRRRRRRPAGTGRKAVAPGATLTLSSKNYSSWSLRGWLLVRFAGLPFDEVMVSPDDADATQGAAASRALDPRALPDHDGAKVWNTLAIAQYLDEVRPEAGLLPDDRIARAHCRSVCGEMNSGLRQPALGAADEPEGAPPGLQGLGRRPARHRPHRRDLDRVPRQPTAARGCSASAGRWPTRCSRRSRRASSPTTSSSASPASSTARR
jgi:hypothetical protein